MIDETFRKIEDRIGQADTLNRESKSELLDLLGRLKGEVSELSKTNLDQAQSIAGFADLSTHEATRTQKAPQLLDHALGGLSSAVADFEESHPHLVEIANRISTMLSNMGI
jgi:hypothetical protein